jgi:GNAT superfamily N-acetyltransferase
MVLAEAHGQVAGFAYGFTFAADRWWRHAIDEPDETRGHPKFAVMELAVLPKWRGSGVGRDLMALLLDDRPEAFGTLCANPSAPAPRIYRRWGWQLVGMSDPPHLGPMEVLIKRLSA